MTLQEFEKKAKSMGDFYLYYRKETDNNTTYLVGTTDLTTPYIAARLKNLKPKDGEILVWSWNSNKLRKIPLSRIKKLVPLVTVLRNHH